MPPIIPSHTFVKLSGNLATVAGLPMSNTSADLESEVFGVISFKTDGNGNFSCSLKVPDVENGGSERYLFNAPVGCAVASFSFYVNKKRREYIFGELINQKSFTYFSSHEIDGAEIGMGECVIWFDHTGNQLVVKGRGLSGEMIDTRIS
jgi:hypothetical protein